jgi:hypothetical protein
MIYTYAMTDMPTRVELSNHTKLSQWAFQPQTLPNVCFVSKKLREESILAWLRRTRIVVVGLFMAQSRLEGDLKWFTTCNLPHRAYGLTAVRMLSFLDFGNVYESTSRWGGSGFPHDFIRCCPGLRSLILGLSSPLYFKSLSPVPALRTQEEIAERLNCGALFKLEKLDYLKVSLQTLRHLNWEGGWTREDISEPLRRHLQGGFDKRGGKMKLEIVCENW